jgi:hypothetical protein
VETKLATHAATLSRIVNGVWSVTKGSYSPERHFNAATLAIEIAAIAQEITFFMLGSGEFCTVAAKPRTCVFGLIQRHSVIITNDCY